MQMRNYYINAKEKDWFLNESWYKQSLFTINKKAVVKL